MYRIRVFNQDGTLGGFYSEKGIVSSPDLAKTYSTDSEYQKDLTAAFFASGGLTRYDSFVSPIASPKTISYDINRQKSYLPPFEDKPSRSQLDEPIFVPSIADIDINGGDLSQDQDLDIDGGGA
jgi:hypothetical protein